MKKSYLSYLTPFTLYCLLFFSVTPCFSAAETWNFHLSPYFWLAGLSGYSKVRGKHVEFSSPWSEVRHDLDFSLGAHFEASKGLLSLLLDPDYVKITQHPALDGIHSKTTYETTITDAGIYYSLYKKKADLALLGAGRIITFHTVIDTLQTTQPTSVSDTSSVVVPVVGARLQYDFNSKVRAWLHGDFGGFQVSHVSSTWSGMLGLRYQFTPFFDLSFAYKALAVNYSIKGITINTTLHGPVLACGFSW